MYTWGEEPESAFEPEDIPDSPTRFGSSRDDEYDDVTGDYEPEDYDDYLPEEDCGW